LTNRRKQLFKELYKKHYRSSHKLSEQEAKDLENKKALLEQENEKRLESIFKLKTLIVEDPDNAQIYSLHIRRNRDWINKVQKEIEIIEIKLLEK
jgi:hypothetical protein